MFYLNGEELLTRKYYDSTRVGLNLIKGSKMNKSTEYAWDQSNGKANWTDRLQVLKDDIQQNISVKPNTTYTFSFILDFLDINAQDTGFYFIEQKANGVNTDTYKDNQYTWSTGKIENTAGLHTYTFTTGSQCNLLIMHIRYKGTSSNGFQIERTKLEEGQVATPWIPALSDYATLSDINSLQDQINQLKFQNGGVKPSYTTLYATLKEVA